jgi:aspartyl/glutamyl-tRNA(Asn/Gln) amidotransferase C subunit
LTASETNEPITKEIFDHLVRLAQFELTDEEAIYLRSELNGQLESIRQLASIEIRDETPITSHGVPYDASNRPAIREDVARPSDLAEGILSGAPETDERYIVVPDIPHEELDS